MRRYNYLQAQEINEGIKNGVDVSKFSNPDYSWEQMYLIRDGLEKGLNVSEYANPEICPIEMLEIKSQLENHSINKMMNNMDNLLRMSSLNNINCDNGFNKLDEENHDPNMEYIHSFIDNRINESYHDCPSVIVIDKSFEDEGINIKDIINSKENLNNYKLLQINKGNSPFILTNLNNPFMVIPDEYEFISKEQFNKANEYKNQLVNKIINIKLANENVGLDISISKYVLNKASINFRYLANIIRDIFESDIIVVEADDAVVYTIYPEMHESVINIIELNDVK